MKLTEIIEGELLQTFLVSINDLMSAKQASRKQALISQCRDLATWLHYYNSGQAVQKRYIFSVVEKRIPMNGNSEQETGNSATAWTMFANVMKKSKLLRGDRDDDDGSSAGGWLLSSISSLTVMYLVC